MYRLTNHRENGMYVREQPMLRHYTPVPKVPQSASSSKQPPQYTPQTAHTTTITYKGGCGGCGKNKTLPNEAKTL